MKVKTSQPSAPERGLTIPQLRAAIVTPKLDESGKPRAHKIACGGGLFLQVTPGKVNADGTFHAATSWLGRYVDYTGKTREMGLKGFDINDPNAITTARKWLEDVKKQAKRGQDPMKAKALDKAREAALAGKTRFTFKECAEQYIEQTSRLRKGRWADNVRSSLKNWVYPFVGAKWQNKTPFGDMWVDEVTFQHIEDVLHEPNLGGQILIDTRPQTALKVRMRIATVLDEAKRQKRRQGDNPAALEALRELPKIEDLEVRHHPCVPYRQAPALIQQLDIKNPIQACAAFIAHTGVRTSAAREMVWSEVDEVAQIWRLPGARTKIKPLKHGLDIPLSDAAIAILRAMKVHRQSKDSDAAVFPSQRPRGEGKFLGHGSIRTHIRREFPAFRSKEGEAATTHGWRSTLSTWSAEKQGHCPYEVREMAIGHVTGTKTSRVYARTEYLDQRRPLMDCWSTYLMTGKLVKWVAPVDEDDLEEAA
jgi:integrase